jgi:hypothetical protein
MKKADRVSTALGYEMNVAVPATWPQCFSSRAAMNLQKSLSCFSRYSFEQHFFSILDSASSARLH